MNPIETTIRRGIRNDRMLNALGWIITILCLAVLAGLLFSLIRGGLDRLNWHFLSSFPSRRAGNAGVLSAWVGSLLVMLITASTAIPLGIAAGVYLEEYARKNWFTSVIEINISNLAAVPSIIYGLMALGLLVYEFHLGQSILTGGLTLAFLILPIVIVATREALRSIPQYMREAAFALGASRWQVVRHHLLPYSSGGISTGVIIALSRAIGETAPLVTIGAISYIAFLPPAPFGARPWLVAENSQRAFAEPVRDRPLVAQGATPGAVVLRVRRAGEAQASPTTLEIGPGTTPDGLRERIDAVEGVGAAFTPSGNIALTADAGHEFSFVDDSAGLMGYLGMSPGEGRHGPLEWAGSHFTVLPIQMFNWVSRPDVEFAKNAAAAGVLLMVVTLGMNAIAIAVRARMRRRIKW